MMMKTTNDLTLDDLMGTDFNVWLSCNKQFGYNIYLESEDGEINEQGIHPYAIESLATFCRNFLHDYDIIKQREETA